MQFEKVLSNMHLGCIDISESDKVAIKSLPYFSKPFNDNASVRYWESIGLPFSNGVMYNHTRSTPSIVECITADIERLLTNNNIQPVALTWCFYKMRPGDIIPYHSDTYVAYKKYASTVCKEQDITVHRALVMVDDRQPGHILEINGHQVDWDSGDTFVWTGDTPHLAANLGFSDRYTIQITFSTLTTYD